MSVVVALPIKGAFSSGIAGSVNGLVDGIIAGSAFAIFGALVGASQILIGAVKTMEAFSASIQGKEYDPISERWVFYNLEREAQLALGMTTVRAMAFKCLLLTLKSALSS
jgi:hypothetical protein